MLGAIATRGRHALSRGNPRLEGKHSAQCSLSAKGEAKRGQSPQDYMSPRSAIDRMSLPATIRWSNTRTSTRDRAAFNV